MASYNKFNQFIEDLGLGVHDLDAAADVLNVYASNGTPDAEADAIKTDFAEITPENGYPSGGSDCQNTWTRTTVTATLACQDVVWTASAGGFGPLQYVAMYNDTQTTPVDPLICWWDYGSAVSPAVGETFTVDFGASTFTLA